jgi:hypothetical protein
MAAWFTQLQANALSLAPKALCIHLGIWAWRSHAELDKPLDRLARTVRVVVILCCWLLASLPLMGTGSIVLRVVAMLIGCASLWLPNSVFHVMKYIRRQQFEHIAETLRRWNPMELPIDTEADLSALQVLDVHVPAILDRLQRGAGIREVAGELSRIRREWAATGNDGADLVAAEGLVKWWNSNQEHAVTA